MAEQGIDLSRYLRHGSIVGENGSDDWQTPRVIYEALDLPPRLDTTLS